MTLDRDLGTYDLARHLSRRFASAAATPRGFVEVNDLIALASWIGLREDNQDQAIFCRLLASNPDESFALAMLCDGIGGLKDGGGAARDAVAQTVAFLVNKPLPHGPGALSNAIEVANKYIFEKHRGSSGCTTSAIFFTNRRTEVANVGDSRIYLAANESLSQLSVDDTIAAHLGEAAILDSNDPDLHSLLQYVGLGRSLHVNSLESASTQDAKFYVLSSDGVHFIGAELLRKIQLRAKDAGTLVRRLIALAEWTGGSDNATLIVVPTAIRLNPPNEFAGGKILQVWQPGSSSFEIWLQQSSGVFSQAPQLVPKTPAGKAKVTKRRRKVKESVPNLTDLVGDSPTLPKIGGGDPVDGVDRDLKPPSDTIKAELSVSLTSNTDELQIEPRNQTKNARVIDNP